jgi:hypothetical protein
MRGWPFLDGSKAKFGQCTALCVDSVIGTKPRGFWSNIRRVYRFSQRTPIGAGPLQYLLAEEEGKQSQIPRARWVAASTQTNPEPSLTQLTAFEARPCGGANERNG